MNIKWHNGCWGPWPNHQRRDGDNLSKHQGWVCAQFSTSPFISNAKLRVLTLRVCSSRATKLEVKWVWQSAESESCQLYLCSAEALGVCPGQQGEKHWEGGQHVSEGAVLWRDQGKVLCYTPKQTSATNLEDRGKQIYFHFWIPITTLILRNIYIRKTKT